MYYLISQINVLRKKDSYIIILQMGTLRYQEVK